MQTRQGNVATIRQGLLAVVTLAFGAAQFNGIQRFVRTLELLA